MAASFSPPSHHRDAAASLHLHHGHSAAITQLRRSLSRSPSKTADIRLLAPSSAVGATSAGQNGSCSTCAACAAAAAPSFSLSAGAPVRPATLDSPGKQPRLHPFAHSLPSHHHAHAHHHHHPVHHHQRQHRAPSFHNTLVPAPPFAPSPLSPTRSAHGKFFLVRTADSTPANSASTANCSATPPGSPPRIAVTPAGSFTAPSLTSTTTAPNSAAAATHPATAATHPTRRAHALRRTASLQLCRVRSALNASANGSNTPSRRARQPPTGRQRGALNESRSQGNALPRQQHPQAEGDDDSGTACDMKPASSLSSANSDLRRSISSSSAAIASPTPGIRASNTTQVNKRRSNPIAQSRSASNPFSFATSPLKRSDEAMHLDAEADADIATSPSPKRRTVEGFAGTNGGFALPDAENWNPDGRDAFAGLSTSAPSGRKSLFRHAVPALPRTPAASSSSIPTRSSSLRKSTLQQRQTERPSPLPAPPRRLEMAVDGESGCDTGPRPQIGRARSSTCGDAPSAVDEARSRRQSFHADANNSPFVPMSHSQQQHRRISNYQSHLQQSSNSTSSHPLSRLLTQSSSEESLPDDTPSHEPNRNNASTTNPDDKPRPVIDFSKSLPAGSIRPNCDYADPRAASGASFATPVNYRLVKPLPAAFMSTGLISKKNKNAEDIALAGAKNMPDTPCKRPIFPLFGASTGSGHGLQDATPGDGAGEHVSVGNGSTNGGTSGAKMGGAGRQAMHRSALGQSVMCASSQTGASESSNWDCEDEVAEGVGVGSIVSDDRDKIRGFAANGAPLATTTASTTRATPHAGPFSKGIGIFGSSFVKSRMMRRSSSSGSMDGDLSQISPSARYGPKSVRHSLNAEFPPTPTKIFTPTNTNGNADGGTATSATGSSSIFYTAPTSRFTRPNSSKRLLLQKSLAQSPLRSQPCHHHSPTPHDYDDDAASGDGGATTPGGLTCKFSSCSSPSSPTSGDTVSESECESDDDDGLAIDVGFGGNGGDEDGDTIMGGSPSLVGVHRVRRPRRVVSRRHDRSPHRHHRHRRRQRVVGQEAGFPFSMSSSHRIPRFFQDSARSPSPQEKSGLAPSQHHHHDKFHHKSVSFSSPSPPPATTSSSSSPPSFYTPFSHFSSAAPLGHDAKLNTSQSTASPLDEKSSLFRQSTTSAPPLVTAERQAASSMTSTHDMVPFNSQLSSTPQTPLDGHAPTGNSMHGLPEAGSHSVFATPAGTAAAVAATTTPATTHCFNPAASFNGSVASAASTKYHSFFSNGFPTPAGAALAASANGFPATPTGPRDSLAALGAGGVPNTLDINAFKRASLQQSSHENVDIDACLTSRFGKVEIIGIGEFSQVFMCTNSSGDADAEAGASAMDGVVATPGAHATTTPFTSPSAAVTGHFSVTAGNGLRAEKVWAVKKSKQPFSGARDRDRRAKEVDALRRLKGFRHLICFEDSWESNGHLYIQTEFCEEGSLQAFLGLNGLKGRLDDFRTWKIMLELAEGLRSIHDSGYIHLDLKPANVLITGEGILKIADFGLATPWPAEPGVDGEGDREYIGPEILMGRYDKPADIFALGLIVFETAGNVELPDNGPAWQKLRNGDLSDVVCLSWRDEENGPTHRDSRGNPIPRDFPLSPNTKAARARELAEPPEFMVSPAHESSLDSVVRWMITPDPEGRPTAQQVLDLQGARWVTQRRRAGAIVYEGNWGPAEDGQISGEDEEMFDV